MRVVLDTNVLLAGLATRGACEGILDFCVDSPDLMVILSEPILAEFCEHYHAKFGMTMEQTREASAFLRELARIVVPDSVPVSACRDAKDLMVLGTAVAGRAHCLVSGDTDLLTIKAFCGISIVSPRQFYDQIRS